MNIANITKLIKIGNIYKGATLVYQSALPVTYYVDSGVTYTEKVAPGKTVLSPLTFTPSKSGWTFVGWRENNTADSSVLSDKTMGHSAMNLYAVFKQDVTCYTYNNSSSATSTTKQRYYNNGNVVNPSFTLSQNSASGWNADGWCTSSGATAGIAVANGGSVTLSANATYYGRYSQTIYLYYNGNGATSGSTATQSGTRYYNSGNYSNPSFTVRSNGFGRTYYSFANWSLNWGTRYNPGASVTLSSSATMYAMWNASTTSKTITKNATAYVNNWIGVRTLVLYGATFTSTPSISFSGNIYDEAGNRKVNVVAAYKSFCIISGAHMSGGHVDCTMTISGTAYESASAAGMTTRNGTFSVAINNWNSHTQNINYGVTFKSNPTVTWYATGNESTAWNNNCSISNQSTAGCTMTFSGPSGGTWTNGLGWVAEGNI